MPNQKSKRDSFVFYRSFYEAIVTVSEKDQLEIYKNIVEYALNGKNNVKNGVSSLIFGLIKPQLDSNYLKYKNGKKGGVYGKLGGRPITPQKPLRGYFENPTKTPNANVNVNVNDNVNGVCPSDVKKTNTNLDNETGYDRSAYTDEEWERCREIREQYKEGKNSWLEVKNPIKDKKEVA